jgi:hypothetical protein
MLLKMEKSTSWKMLTFSIFMIILVLLGSVGVNALTRTEFKKIVSEALSLHFESNPSPYTVDYLLDLIEKYESGEDPINLAGIGTNTGKDFSTILGDIIFELSHKGIDIPCDFISGQKCSNDDCTSLYSCDYGIGNCTGSDFCCAGSCLDTPLCTCDTIPGQCESGCLCDPDCSGLPLTLFWHNYGGSAWDSNDGVNKLTPVKNQGTCGSCWAFATIAALESNYKLFHATTIDLSEQDLISCGSEVYSGLKGCGGANLGQINYAFYYTTQGIASEGDYPYTDINAGESEISTSPCNYKSPSYKASYWRYVLPSTDDNIKKNILNEGPLFTVINMNSWLVKRDGTCSGAGSSVDHTVLVVGWDEEGWIIRNSWGPINHYNHNNGYFKVNYNQCNIHLAEPDFPVDVTNV